MTTNTAALWTVGRAVAAAEAQRPLEQTHTSRGAPAEHRHTPPHGTAGLAAARRRTTDASISLVALVVKRESTASVYCRRNGGGVGGETVHSRP